MIWESRTLMTLIDLAICTAVALSLWRLLARRREISGSGLLSGLWAVSFGLLLIGLFYLSDLVVMWVLPFAASVEAAMATMEALHLNYSWLVLLVATAALVWGFGRLQQRLFAALEQVRDSERRLSERIAYDELVLELATSFLAPSDEDVESRLEAALRRISETLDYDRVTHLEFAAESESVGSIQTYSRAGMSSGPMTDAERTFPWLLGHLKKGQSVLMPSLDDLPEEASSGRAYCEEAGIRAAAAIPYTTEGAVRGGIGVSHRTDRSFSEEFVRGLRLVAEIVGLGVSAVRAQVEVRRSEERYRSFVANSAEGVWRIELDQPWPADLSEKEHVENMLRYGWLAECNDTYARMCGYDKASDIIGMRFGEWFPESNRDPEFLERATVRSLKPEGANPESGELITREVDSQGNVRYFNRHIVAIVDNGFVVRSWGSKRDITERFLAERRVLEYQDRLRALASELSLAEERERRRLAADLHDRLMQTLGVCKMRLAALRKAATSPRLQPLLDEVSDLTEESIRESRSLMFDLSPPVLYELGLEAAVDWLAEETERRHGLDCTVRDDQRRKPLSDDVRVVLFQTVRELLLNVAKHARAQNAVVRLRRQGEIIEISVEDDGRGFELSHLEAGPSGRGGFGLFQIRDRVDLLGGRVEIDSRPGSGCRVVVTAPLELAKDKVA